MKDEDVLEADTDFGKEEVSQNLKPVKFKYGMPFSKMLVRANESRFDSKFILRSCFNKSEKKDQELIFIGSDRASRAFKDLSALYGVNDLGFVSAWDSELKTPANEAHTKQLRGELRSGAYGVIEIAGAYKFRNVETKEGKSGEEKSFGVINDRKDKFKQTISQDTASFFQFIIMMGDRYDQETVLLCPANDFQLMTKTLQGGRGYWFYGKASEDMAGRIRDMGYMREGIVEEWLANRDVNNEPDGIEAMGWSAPRLKQDKGETPVQFRGGKEETEEWFDPEENDRLLKSRFVISGIDYSDAWVGWMGPQMFTQVNSKRNRAIQAAKKYFEETYGSSPYLRRESIKSSYLTQKIDGLEAVENLIEIGMSTEGAHELMEHWKEGGDEVMSSTGPHTLAEWKLYEKAKKMYDGGFSYQDSLSILSRDSGIPYGKVRNIVGTAEEWRLGYFDFGLEPLISEKIRSQ